MHIAAQKSPEAFRTISEVADELDVPQHVLRFWESRFGAVKPLKRGGGRRYYRPDDVDLLRGIRALLYSDGLTIKGVQKVLRQHGARYVMELGRGAASHLENLRGDSGASEKPAPAIASNVHLFPQGGLFAQVEDARTEDVRSYGKPAEGESGGRLTGADRAHFTGLLEELVDLKARLQAARKDAGNV